MKLFYFLFFILMGCQQNHTSKSILLLSKCDFDGNRPITSDQCEIIYDTMYIKISNYFQDTIYLDRYGEGDQQCFSEVKVKYYAIKDDVKVIPYSLGIRDYFGAQYYDTIPPGKSNYYLIDSIVISSRIIHNKDVSLSEFYYSYKKGSSNNEEYFKLLVIEQNGEIKQANFSLPSDFDEFVLPSGQ
mgnify:CR=1 FL=1